jgi:hypothetical protein
MPSWELRTRSTGIRRPSAKVRTYRCTLGSFIFPGHAVLPTLPMRWGRVLLPVRLGGCRTGAASSYRRRGYPCLKVPTSTIVKTIETNLRVAILETHLRMGKVLKLELSD